MIKFFRCVTGFAIGMAAGIAAGLLLAPASGEELRLSIADYVTDALEEGRLAAAETRASLERQLTEASQVGQSSTKRA